MNIIVQITVLSMALISPINLLFAEGPVSRDVAKQNQATVAGSSDIIYKDTMFPASTPLASRIKEVGGYNIFAFGFPELTIPNPNYLKSDSRGFSDPTENLNFIIGGTIPYVDHRTGKKGDLLIVGFSSKGELLLVFEPEYLSYNGSLRLNYKALSASQIYLLNSKSLKINRVYRGGVVGVYNVFETVPEAVDMNGTELTNLTATPKSSLKSTSKILDLGALVNIQTNRLDINAHGEFKVRIDGSENKKQFTLIWSHGPENIYEYSLQPISGDEGYNEYTITSHGTMVPSISIVRVGDPPIWAEVSSGKAIASSRNPIHLPVKSGPSFSGKEESCDSSFK